MNFLVTGGCGFIGSHLVELLISEKHHVTVVDNLYSGKLSNLPSSKKLAFHHCDISEKIFIKHLKNIDIVFHLAGVADIVPSIENPELYYKTNVTGTYNVLEGCITHKVKKLIYAASSSCYGIPEMYPTNEDEPLSPQYPYALTKKMGEDLVMHWGQVYKLKVNSMRLFNVYGPRSRTAGAYGAVFGVFLAQKINNKPFTVVGDGNQSRDFTYVSDVVKAFYLSATKDISGEIFNVGSGNHYTINKLVELIGGEKINIPKRPGEPDITFADIAKIKKLLNWSPKVNFKDGVWEMLKHIELWKDAPVWDENSINTATETWFKFLK